MTAPVETCSQFYLEASFGTYFDALQYRDYNPAILFSRYPATVFYLNGQTLTVVGGGPIVRRESDGQLFETGADSAFLPVACTISDGTNLDCFSDGATHFGYVQTDETVPQAYLLDTADSTVYTVSVVAAC